MAAFTTRTCRSWAIRMVVQVEVQIVVNASLHPVSFGTFRQALHNFELGTELVALSILTRSAPQPQAEEGRAESHGPVGHDFQHGRTSRSKFLTRRLQGSALLLPGR